mmetsp:Transcript_25890/g.90145  ORF Transcript_25890/g.90145 Transcript_25890/m.90145 type:complete len:300 (-) Transcript_25890:255-1154(-)
MEAKSTEPQGWKLAKENELRFEVAEGGTALLSLRGGTAEVFGVELVEGKDYTFPGGSKVAVFSWYGAELTTAGHLASAYVSDDTPMQAYSNVHQRLEARRDAAGTTGGLGPRVMVVGPTDSGKTSTCRVLLSYAVRRGRTPAFVDLDVGQGSITVPGVISATPVEKKCLSVLEGFRHTVPLSYWYGDVNLGANPELFRRLVARLAAALNTRITDPMARASGLIINTGGWVDGLGKELLVYTARQLAVDIVLVMGQDKLHADLKRDLGSGAGGGAGAATKGRRADFTKEFKTGAIRGLRR